MRDWGHVTVCVCNLYIEIYLETLLDILKLLLELQIKCNNTDMRHSRPHTHTHGKDRTLHSQVNVIRIRVGVDVLIDRC